MSATNLTRSGLADYLVQRFSAVILLAYVLFLVWFFAVCGGQPTYDEWFGLFRNTPVRIFTLIAMVALTGHIWVGVWTILTDYVRATGLRLLLLALLALGVFAQLAWVVTVLWQL